MIVQTANRPAHRTLNEKPQPEPPAPKDPNCGLVTDLVCVTGGTLLGAGAGMLGGVHWAMARAGATGGSLGLLLVGPPLAMFLGGACMVAGGLAGGGLGIALANQLRDC